MKDRRKELIRKAVAYRQNDVAVLLDNIVDSHNIGAVLRTCDSVGIQNVHVLNFENEAGKRLFTVGKRSSSGARKWVDVQLHMDNTSALHHLKSKYKRLLVTKVDPKAVSLFELDLKEPCIIAFGNEDKGVSQEVIDAADELVYIPQVGLTKSLNISVACAIALYELYRQRKVAGMYHEDPLRDDWHINLLQDFHERHSGGYKGELPKFDP
jgi:tRNA (guanosine-2'-O-)-methyltransferase